MNKWAANFMAFLSMASFANAQAGSNVSGDYWIDIQQDPADDECALFTIQMAKDRWFGFGFGAAMTSSVDYVQIDGTTQEVKAMKQ